MSTLAGAITTYRTNYAGTLGLPDVGSAVRLGGWVHNKRNLGGLIFVDLRDRTGLVQISFDPEQVDASTLQSAAQVGKESVVLIEGDVVARPPAGRNPDLATGEVEVKAPRDPNAAR